MKRTLFSCCIWLTSLAAVFFSGEIVRAESCCRTTVRTADNGDCVCPYAETESYGECHWSYNHCDPVAEIAESEAVASEELAPREPVDAPEQASDAAPLADDTADYWYDSESGSYYSYEFTDEATVSDESAEDALDDLFDFANTEDAEPVTNAQTGEATSDTADTDANEYGDDYSQEGAYDWDEEDGLDYSDESYLDEIFQGTETAVTEVANDATDDAVPQADEYDYASEYEDYGWEDDQPSYCPEDEVPAVEPTQDVTVSEPAEETTGDSLWQDSIVEDPWRHDYDYSYEDEQYEYRYGGEYNYDAEVTEETQWDTGDEPVAEQVAEDAWEDEYYSDYEEYYSEYDDTWADDDQTAETEEAVEPVAEDAEVVESWDDEQYYYYDDDEYEYGYDYEYWENQASDAPVVEAEAPVATVEDEDTNALPREAVLSLAHTLDRFGSALQNLSRKLTNMVSEEVAEAPTAETTQR